MKTKEDLYAEDVMRLFLPRKPNGELFSYTRYPTSAHPPETCVRPSLSDCEVL
jgi:hypothetical protein